MTPNLELEVTAYTIKQIPSSKVEQVAFAGRSNVGKSSLINALAGRKMLAKTSSQPGKTRSINFYAVKPGGFQLVDLPGYGYAKVSQTQRREFATLIEHYFKCIQLKLLALLIDCRLPPQKIDLYLVELAKSHNLPLLPILTKVDKCRQKEKVLRLAEWQKILGVEPILTSATKRDGILELWQVLLDFFNPTNTPPKEKTNEPV